jgi:hypothetical protein
MARVVADDGGAHAAAVLRMHGLHVRAMRRIRHRRVRHAAVMHGDVIHAHAGHASHIRLAGHASRIRTAGAHARPHANEVAASMQRASLATLFHALSLRLASIMPVRPASMRSLR